jgi:hypothetical protein
MTLIEASFDVAATLNEIAEREGLAPNIVGIHSIERGRGGQVSIYLSVDDPGLDCGMGCEGFIIVLVSERAIAGMDHGEILEALTGRGGTVH